MPSPLQLHEIIDTTHVDQAALREVLFGFGRWPSATAAALALAENRDASDDVLPLHVAAMRMLAAQRKPAEPVELFESLQALIEQNTAPELRASDVARAWLALSPPPVTPAPPLPVLVKLVGALFFRLYHPAFTDPTWTADELRARGEAQVREGEQMKAFARAKRANRSPQD